jgi:hypothetical protein
LGEARFFAGFGNFGLPISQIEFRRGTVWLTMKDCVLAVVSPLFEELK